jgi:hypothetical protein
VRRPLDKFADGSGLEAMPDGGKTRPLVRPESLGGAKLVGPESGRIGVAGVTGGLACGGTGNGSASIGITGGIAEGATGIGSVSIGIMEPGVASRGAV